MSKKPFPLPYIQCLIKLCSLSPRLLIFFISAFSFDVSSYRAWQRVRRGRSIETFFVLEGGGIYLAVISGEVGKPMSGIKFAFW